jgi:hypothetical protein
VRIADPLSTPSALKPLVLMTCMASRTDAVPGREMSGFIGKLRVGEETDCLNTDGILSGGRDRRCSRRTAEVKIRGADEPDEVMAIRCTPEAKTERRALRGVSESYEW